jgi:hypothetical protein
MDAISVDNPDHARLLPQLWDVQAGKSTLWDLSSTYPTIGIDGDDVVYMVTKVKFHDKKAWMIGVDLAKRAVEVLIPVSSQRVGNFKPDVILACEFSEYLNATARYISLVIIFAYNISVNLVTQYINTNFQTNNFLYI